MQTLQSTRCFTENGEGRRSFDPEALIGFGKKVNRSTSSGYFSRGRVGAPGSTAYRNGGSLGAFSPAALWHRGAGVLAVRTASSLAVRWVSEAARGVSGVSTEFPFINVCFSSGSLLPVLKCAGRDESVLAHVCSKNPGSTTVQGNRGKVRFQNCPGRPWLRREYVITPGLFVQFEK